MRIHTFVIAFLTVAAPVFAQAPAEVQVFPPDINLFNSRGRQTFVVQAVQADGITRDVTAQAKVTATATEAVRQTCGTRFADTSEHHEAISRWLEAKAPNDPPTVALPVSVDLYPKHAVLDGKGATQQMIVRAKYSDGSERDVTNLAL